MQLKAPLPYLDDDSETTYETPMFLFFKLKINLYLSLSVNETKNPQHLDCGKSIPATHARILIVSYTRVYETSARCLRSIYPSLGMRQLFDDVTMGK